MKFLAMERKYGSGGTEIATKLAERLNIHLYDTEILEMGAKALHTTMEYMMKMANGRSGYGSGVQFVTTYSTNISGFTISNADKGNAHLVQKAAILEYVKKGDGIILGHCAPQILADNPNVLKVFVDASVSDKTDRMYKEYGIKADELRKTEKQVNHFRSDYIKYNFGVEWDDVLSGYDVILNSSTLGIDGCVDVIEMMMKR